LHNQHGEQQFASSGKEESIRQAVRAADTVLAVFKNKAAVEVSTEERLQNLEAIIRRAAGFAFVLFSQPSSWKFQWVGQTGRHQESIVIFPGLEQSVDDEGHARSPPGVVSKPEIASYK